MSYNNCSLRKNIICQTCKKVSLTKAHKLRLAHVTIAVSFFDDGILLWAAVFAAQCLAVHSSYKHRSSVEVQIRTVHVTQYVRQASGPAHFAIVLQAG